MPNNNGSRIIAISVASILSAGAAVAADAPASDSAELTEVVVTANKLNATKVLDTPASIQALSGDALQKDGAAEIMDIAGDIPGLSIQDLGPGDKKYVIRGINSTGASTTGVYYGEAVISGSNADDGGGFETDIRLYDLDRVEVLRGPQGTLYGASSMSGTIRFMPKLPNLSTVEGYGTAEYSNTSHTPKENYNFNGAVNLPIIDGVLAVRAVGWKLYNAGYVDQTRVGTVGLIKGVNDDDVGGARVAVRYQPFEELTIDANYTKQTEKSGGSSRWTPAGITAFNGGPIAPVQGCDLCNTDVTQSPWTDNLQVFGATVTYDTHHGTVTATSNQFNRTTGFTFDSTPILVSFDVPIPAETLEPRTRRVNSSELRYASQLDLPVNFVIGGYREHEKQDLAVEVIKTNDFGLVNGPFSSANSDDALGSPNGNTFFGRTDSRTTTQWAGFGEVTWKATDALTAIAGIRYFTETLNGVQTQTHPFGGFPPDAPNLVPIPDPQQTFNKITWKENISYKFSDAVLAYETISTGFRSGGLNAVSEPFEPIPKAYAPDSLTNFEAGLKGRLFNNSLEYQVDGYFIRWDNIQVQETTADAAFVYLGNAGRAHVKGVEFELTARPMEYLTATLAGSYQDAFLVEGASADQYALNNTLGRTGDDIPNVPKMQFNIGLNYTRPISGDWEGLGAVDVTYRDSVDAYFASNKDFNLVLKPYTLVNLRLGVINGPWTVAAFARNITDKRAEVSAINSTQDPHALLTVRPRTVGITVTRKF
ncbi:MAG: TonB-dependent receptor [Proteobacteria bacterium]|nr:TonB-dependent receptor [Pseudomonadota bacterium]